MLLKSLVLLSEQRLFEALMEVDGCKNLQIFGLVQPRQLATNISIWYLKLNFILDFVVSNKNICFFFFHIRDSLLNLQCIWTTAVDYVLKKHQITCISDSYSVFSSGETIICVFLDINMICVLTKVFCCYNLEYSRSRPPAAYVFLRFQHPVSLFYSPLCLFHDL